MLGPPVTSADHDRTLTVMQKDHPSLYQKGKCWETIYLMYAYIDSNYGSTHCIFFIRLVKKK